MRNSRRIKRMSRNRLKIGKMNLTSLMDVFTLLVFFLLVNSGSVEVMENPKTVTLPESNVEAKPRETVVVFVTRDEVLVQGRVVAQLSDVLDADDASIDSIAARLAELSEQIIGPATKVVAGSREVTILADKAVPFAAIKRIMSACTGQGYGNVSLAVIQKTSQTPAI